MAPTDVIYCHWAFGPNDSRRTEFIQLGSTAWRLPHRWSRDSVRLVLIVEANTVYSPRDPRVPAALKDLERRLRIHGTSRHPP